MKEVQVCVNCYQAILTQPYDSKELEYQRMNPIPAKRRRKLPAKSSATRRTPETHFDHLQKLTTTLRGNLEKCAKEPHVDPVHDLRTGTRRVQAMVEALMRERGNETPFQETAAKWLGYLKKLRRAAAPVRDLDVHRKLLEKLVKLPKSKADASANASPETNPEAGQEAITDANAPPSLVNEPQIALPLSDVEQQADHLDAWLQHARQHQAATLRKKAAKWLPKFDAEAAALESAIHETHRTRRRAQSAADIALESFVRLAHEMQQLDAGNLHDFRKGAKKARYIAESAAEDAHALAIGKALKKLQDEIGDWHDWLVLGDEARAALGDEGKALIAMIDRERDQHYVSSMKTVTRMRGRLMGEWMATTAQPRRRNISTSSEKILRA